MTSAYKTGETVRVTATFAFISGTVIPLPSCYGGGLGALVDSGYNSAGGRWYVRARQIGSGRICSLSLSDVPTAALVTP